MTDTELYADWNFPTKRPRGPGRRFMKRQMFSDETLKDPDILPILTPLVPKKATSFKSKQRQTLLNELMSIQAELLDIDTKPLRVLALNDRIDEMRAFFEKNL